MSDLMNSVAITRKRSFGMTCNGERTFTFHHGLNTRDVAYYFYDENDNPVVWGGGFVVHKHLNSIVFEFGLCPESGKSYKLLVVG